MDPRNAGPTRRWRLTVAIVAALSVFVALIAGSSMRPRFAAAVLPEPAAWTHGAQDIQAHPGHAQRHAGAQLVSRLAQDFSPDYAPTNKKPFHSMWMTKDRPAGWTHVSPQSGWPLLPASFAGSEFQPRGARCAAPAAIAVNQDILTRFCVDRC
jgi:hypothetical protein